MNVLTLPAADSFSTRARALVWEDPQSRALRERIQQVAPSDATIYLSGEPGTGKEIVARYVHDLSSRRAQPFISVNCGAWPKDQVESELFGYDRSAFAGAPQEQPGWLESAQGGSVFLAEVHELPLSTQVKLLRLLQDGEIVRVGARRPVRVDVRVIASSDVDLDEAVRAGRFREDLYYRLNVAPLALSPLRERPGDIVPIAEHFVAVYAQRLKLEPRPHLGPEVQAALRAHAWPGNIRELENVIHHALLVGRSSSVRLEDLRLDSGVSLRPEPVAGAAPRTAASANPVKPLAQPELASLEAVFSDLFEQDQPQLLEHVLGRLVLAAYQHCERNQVHTARLLGISRNVLRARLQQVGVLGGGRPREQAEEAQTSG